MGASVQSQTAFSVWSFIADMVGRFPEMRPQAMAFLNRVGNDTWAPPSFYRDQPALRGPI